MMNRRHLLHAIALGAAACALARPAAAQGLIRFHNGGAPVAVEVRVGETADRAALFGNRTLAKGETWEVDTSGALAWWRREVTPGANDGRFTAWKSVDTLSSDEKIEV